jgi:hypothetical protein
MPDHEVVLWMGRPIEDLSKEELIEVVKHLARDLDETRKRAIRAIRDLTPSSP